MKKEKLPSVEKRIQECTQCNGTPDLRISERLHHGKKKVENIKLQYCHGCMLVVKWKMKEKDNEK